MSSCDRLAMELPVTVQRTTWNCFDMVSPPHLITLIPFSSKLHDFIRESRRIYTLDIKGVLHLHQILLRTVISRNKLEIIWNFLMFSNSRFVCRFHVNSWWWCWMSTHSFCTDTWDSRGGLCESRRYYIGTVCTTSIVIKNRINMRFEWNASVYIGKSFSWLAPR